MNDIIKIINEEIEAFNFLDHEKLIKEDKYNSILSTPKFTDLNQNIVSAKPLFKKESVSISSIFEKIKNNILNNI